MYAVVYSSPFLLQPVHWGYERRRGVREEEKEDGERGREGGERERERRRGCERRMRKRD